jgi:hypothetical protein
MKKKASPEELTTLPELAKANGVTRQRLFAVTHERKIEPWFRSGNTSIYLKTDFDQYLKELRERWQ